MKHTMSMYATKDAMIEAMHSEIDSLEAQLAEARKDSERLDYVIDQCEVWTGTENHTKREKIESREQIDNSMKGGE